MDVFSENGICVPNLLFYEFSLMYHTHARTHTHTHTHTPKIMLASSGMLTFNFKAKTYIAPLAMQLLKSLPVCVLTKESHLSGMEYFSM
jgi:hypothetical protein